MFQSHRCHLLIIYLIAIHPVWGALVYTLFFKPQNDKWPHRLHSFYSRVDANVESGAYLFSLPVIRSDAVSPTWHAISKASTKLIDSDNHRAPPA